MDNRLFLALTTTDSYEEIMTMERIIESVATVTGVLVLIILMLYIYNLIAKVTALKTGTSTDLYFEFIINLVIGMLWGFIILINEVIAWASSDGEVRIFLKTFAPICAGFCIIKAVLELMRIKKLSKIAGQISIVLVDPESENALQSYNTQPFVYPYREGKGEGRAPESDKTEAVVAGSNA